MARARNIKPSIMDNDSLGGLAPLTRLLFIYLWMLADREGRLEDRPKRIAAQALPFDREADVAAMLSDLEDAGFITRYTVDGVALILIDKFTQHQAPHVRERDSHLPAPPFCQGEVQQGTAKAVPDHNLGSAKAGPSTDLGGGMSSPRPPDSLIPDSLIPDCGLGMETSSAPATQPPVGGNPPKVKKSKPLVIARPDDVTPQVWDDWLTLRNAKRAPVTVTVLEDARVEARKAGMPLEAFLRIWCRRGSQGLEASWIKADELQANRTIASATGETPRELRQRRLLAEFTGGLMGRDDDETPPHPTFDMEVPPNVLPFALGR